MLYKQSFLKYLDIAVL